MTTLHDLLEEARLKDLYLSGAKEEQDVVNHPQHYKTGGIESIDYIEAKLGIDGAYAFCMGNVIKYCSRAGKKDITKQKEDLMKAKWYLERAIGYC